MRIIRDRLNPDTLTAWRIVDLRELVIALAAAETESLQKCIVCRVHDLIWGSIDCPKPRQSEQLPRDAVASVEDYAEMLGFELDPRGG